MQNNNLHCKGMKLFLLDNIFANHFGCKNVINWGIFCSMTSLKCRFSRCFSDIQLLRYYLLVHSRVSIYIFE